MNSKIEKLVKIADKLDELGLSEEADVIDSVIEDESTVISVPPEEFELIKNIYDALGKSLE